jgi:hypothetical protein
MHAARGVDSPPHVPSGLFAQCRQQLGRALFRAMSLSNTPWWTFHLYAFIPAFPAPFVEISGNTITPHEWRNQMEMHEKIQIDGLTKKSGDF